MKVLLVRLGVLGTVVALGWITIANAQRGNDGGNPLRGSATADDSTATNDESAPSRPPANDPFGLQDRRAPLAATSGTADAGGTIPSAGAAGLPPARDETARAQSRYGSRATVSGSAEAPANGPALNSADSARPPDDRFARSVSRDAGTNGVGSRYAAPPASTLPAVSPPDTQEPPRLRADPSAMPASPMLGTTPKRENFAAPANNRETLAAPVNNRNSFVAPSNDRANEVPAEGEGVGQPGDAQLEGVQSPQLAIQKFAPREVQMGKPATFRVTVRNTGSIPACEVEVYDQVPRGARLVATMPQAKRGLRGELVWTLGTIKPGEETKVEMQVVPTAEGEIGSVATVHFGADASARSIVTRPQLVVETKAPNQVMIGERVTMSITVSNPGTGIATGVVLSEQIPPGLQHPAGAELEYQVGDLKPGESRKLDLPLVAARPGVATNLLTARGDGSLRAENQCKLEVLAPQLNVAVEGPKRRYLERQATYQVSVSNPGTASAKGVDLVAQLPPGLKFMKANNAGYYEEATRTVHWRLEELPANETGSVELVTMPIEAGQQALKLRGTAEKGLLAEKEQPVVVEGIAAILFQVSDTADPVEVGGETTFEVHVVNQGSKASANVRLAIDLPPELKPVAAEGPTRHLLEGTRITFDGLSQLPPKADTTYRVRVKALRSGDLRTRFQLMTDDMRTPVTKEESTRVYADE
ncbi:MAG: hypothetical protein WCB27_26350 [Thermoguttaceae bacterium]|jgi:uncharacterized repeat protein (TIGR01451 family)